MKKTVYWISMGSTGAFKDLKIMREDTTEEKIQKSYSQNIYFDTERDAEKFAEKLVGFFKSNYTRADTENWTYTKN